MPDGTYWIAKMSDTPVGGIFTMNGPDIRRRAASTGLPISRSMMSTHA